MGIEASHESGSQAPKIEQAPYTPQHSEEMERAEKQAALQDAQNADELLDQIALKPWPRNSPEIYKLALANIGPSKVTTASYYSDYFQGRLTTSEVPFDQNQLMAAYPKYLPGAKLRVTNLVNNKSVIVTVLDKGPAPSSPHGLDLSKAAFSRIADLKSGVAKVRIQPLPPTQNA